MISLGWSQLRRDLRAGDLWMIAGALVLAVSSLTTVAFFSDRLTIGLARDAAQLLGGDVVVSSDNPLPSSFKDQALARSLSFTSIVVFPTMAQSDRGEQAQTKLVSLKAVGPGYPLRGQMLLAQGVGASALPAAGPPEKGTVWVDPALLDALGIQVGDQVRLGDRGFQVSRIVVSEPDRGAGFANFAPRVLMNWDDVVDTGLIQPASRVSYRLAVAAPQDSSDSRKSLAEFQQWTRQALDATGTALKGVRLESLESGRPEMTQTLSRAGAFLNLVTLLAALIAAVALAVAMRQFAHARLRACALLRVFGISQAGIVGLYAVELLTLAIVASGVGVVLGYTVQLALANAVGGLVQMSLPLPSWRPIVLGMGVGILLVVALGLAPLVQLAKVPTNRVLRRDLGPPKAAMGLSLMAAGAGLALILGWVAQDLALTAIVLLGFAFAGVVFVATAYGAVRGLRRLVGAAAVPTWAKIACRQLAASPVATSFQVASLSFGLLAMLLLVLLRTDLVQEWRKNSGASAPDRFVINVLPEQSLAFQAALNQGQAQIMDLYPMIRGRLVQINGKDVGAEQFTDQRAKRLVDREFNLSTSATLPAHNQLVSGQWQPNEAGAISMEEGIAQTLGLKLGDALVFDVAGVTSEVRVTSVRKVDWSSMRANFFALYPAHNLPDFPQTLMATLKVPSGSQLDRQLVQQFPNITIVDTRQTVMQLQKVLQQVITAVELLFSFTLVAGMWVVATSLSGTRAERLHELSVMRAMGASRSLLIKVQRTELCLLGALAGGVACLVANAIALLLSRYVFDFAWSFSWMSAVLGLGAGVVLSLAAGTFALRGITSRPVIESLRQLG